ncbi:MAG TPA: hypothetical protein VM689_25895 [Aliidongia sp.]|nr:hypothetical protein [Aliidongia sp.]
MTRKQADTDRSRGGPGSSHQRPDKPAERDEAPKPGLATSGRRSRISGGGGERDSHHTHDPATKS